jgi:hypothetical protein
LIALAVILAVADQAPSGVGWTMMFLADVPAPYMEPLAIGRLRLPSETLNGFAVSGRSTVQRLRSRALPSNSSERTGPVGHSSSGRVTRTSTEAVDLPPEASVTVTVAV